MTTTSPPPAEGSAGGPGMSSAGTVASRAAARTSPNTSSSRSDSTRCSSRSASSRARPFLWMTAMRLQNMSVTSSRAEVRSTWMRLASSVNRLSSPILLKSAASVTLASPAKWEIFPGGTPPSHASVGPSASRSAKWARRSLNFPMLAAFAGVFSRPDSLRLVARSSRSTSVSRARCAGVILAATAVKAFPLTSVRILATILCSMV